MSEALSRYASRPVGILGLGRSGMAAARALRAARADVRVFDDGEAAMAAAVAEGFVTGAVEGLSLLVPSPGIPLTHPVPHPVIAAARAAGVAIRGDIDLFVEAVAPRPIVGVTGTNGKSTTTALIHHLLVEAGVDAVRGGNIGEPVWALDPGGPQRVLVLELSSYQLDLCENLGCRVAVWLNLTPDHLDRHGDMDGYQAAKMRIFAGQQASDHAVVAVDDEPSRAVAAMLTMLAATRGTGGAVLPVSAATAVAGGVFVEDGRLIDTIDGGRVPVADLSGVASLRGPHNRQNAAAAYAAVRALGVPPQEAARGLTTFQGLPHRLEEVARAANVRFVNDSKATNPDAAARALASFEHVFWIAGGRPKPGGFAGLRGEMDHVRKAFLIGEAAAEIERDLGDLVPVDRCGTLEAATEAALTAARDSGLRAPVVLLAPGCASFDQFRDYEQRGDAFRALALSLGGPD